jgi:hypothetical protein
LIADTKEALVKEMHRNNSFHGTGFKYDTPMKDGKRWVVWFTADILLYLKKEQNRGVTKNDRG